MLPILIVDDAREDIALATRVLFQCRILNPITTFVNGRECVEFIEGQGQKDQDRAPFLMLLDLAMSPLSGIQILCHLQKLAENSPPIARSVVVMVSGVQDLKLVNEGYRCGATTFLMKPLQIEDVMQMVSAVKTLKLERRPEGNVISLA